jgi:membrane protein DedA with SNARE-associated domain
MDPTTVSTFLGTWGYPALLFLLLLTGIGSPIPEDLLLLTAGYLIFSGVFEWPVALAVCLAGVVLSDLMLYSAGRHVGWWTARRRNPRFLNHKRLLRVTGWFGRCGNWLILAARLLPGTRAIVFVTAGLRTVPAWSFLRFDLLGALLWVPAMLAVGHLVGSRIGGVGQVMEWFTRGAPWVAALAGALLLIWLWMGREESKL